MRQSGKAKDLLCLIKRDMEIYLQSINDENKNIMYHKYNRMTGRDIGGVNVKIGTIMQRINFQNL